MWRDEVASRLSSYKARRRRKIEGNYSMHLDFEPEPEASARDFSHAVAEKSAGREVFDTNYYRRANAESMVMPGTSAAAAAFAMAPVVEPEPQAPEPQVEPDEDLDMRDQLDAIEALANPPAQPEDDDDEWIEPERVISAAVPPPPPAPVSNVIVFPRPLMEPPLAPVSRRDELADPVFERPRILDVPEDIVPKIEGPLFADIKLDSHDEADAPATETARIEVPLQVALVQQRVYASLIDWLVVLGCTATFFAFSWKWIAGIPETKPMLMGLAAVPVLIWALYQLIFLMYSGRTLGMDIARLRVSAFDGHRPTRAERRQRAIFTVLSGASMGLGFWWALVDEDTLCWHDRATKTFVTQF